MVSVRSGKESLLETFGCLNMSIYNFKEKNKSQNKNKKTDKADFSGRNSGHNRVPSPPFSLILGTSLLRGTPSYCLPGVLPDTI